MLRCSGPVTHLYSDIFGCNPALRHRNVCGGELELFLCDRLCAPPGPRKAGGGSAQAQRVCHLLPPVTGSGGALRELHSGRAPWHLPLFRHNRFCCILHPSLHYHLLKCTTWTVQLAIVVLCRAVPLPIPILKEVLLTTVRMGSPLGSQHQSQVTCAGMRRRGQRAVPGQRAVEEAV